MSLDRAQACYGDSNSHYSFLTPKIWPAARPRRGSVKSAESDRRRQQPVIHGGMPLTEVLPIQRRFGLVADVVMMTTMKYDCNIRNVS